MKVGFVSTRLAGTDGVSLETCKWAEVARSLGHEVFYCAGQLADDGGAVLVSVHDLEVGHPFLELIR